MTKSTRPNLLPLISIGLSAKCRSHSLKLFWDSSFLRQHKNTNRWCLRRNYCNCIWIQCRLLHLFIAVLLLTKWSQSQANVFLVFTCNMILLGKILCKLGISLDTTISIQSGNFLQSLLHFEVIAQLLAQTLTQTTWYFLKSVVSLKVST